LRLALFRRSLQFLLPSAGMILTAHQPAYLPWLALFHKIALADVFVSYDQAQYQTENWINRNRVRRRESATGILLTVPVRGADHLQKRICDIEIDNEKPWRRKHWNTIRACYGRAPHFARYSGFLEDVYRRDWARIADLDKHMLRWFLEVLGIRVEVVRGSSLQTEGRGSDRVLDLCRIMGADAFLFGRLGRDYAKVADFTALGVRVEFQDYRHPTYDQPSSPFIPHLSVLDLLFNCGASSLDILMSGNDTREALRSRVAGSRRR
jgi:hypothetical protein